ncbi:hypothetical protein Acor_13840 [Acrocarpospora corrugata]|uniref:Uncharacterized protein n=1 Tax=Acrocarpospora corrugata TaxID=35763 RepID=A0A5M3VX20_9ACTN|nr:PucR family transcriptional regulator [Acrocarpospora corrugata]GER99320.1 hypothetical protein Acor_13840 [Acrocarpospora corrugata]
MGPGTDWRRLTELCQAVQDELPELAAQFTDHIRAELDVYDIVPRPEHIRFVRDQAEALLTGLAARLPPSPEQALLARDLGARRARQCIPLEVVLHSYHIGYRDVWNTLLDKADDQELTAALVQLVNLLWTWLRIVSGAAADAHNEISRVQQAAQINLTRRFIQLLRSGQANSDEATELARALTFDPGGTFQVICTPSSWSAEDLTRLRQRLTGTVHAATEGTVTIIVCQHVPARTVADVIHDHRPRLPLGLSLPRPALIGAEAAIVDAERALALASGGGIVDFRDEWLHATLLAHRGRLALLLQPDQDATALPPHLSEAVRAYADHGFSVSAAARVLHVHANTVSYRLDRWHQLTGWDPRTFDGLLKSLLSLKLFP